MNAPLSNLARDTFDKYISRGGFEIHRTYIHIADELVRAQLIWPLGALDSKQDWIELIPRHPVKDAVS